MTTTTIARPDLTIPPPARLARRPRDGRGYLVPWFVEVVDGVYEFRIANARKRVLAVKHGLCWLCGDPLGRFRSFVIGPMCAVNRTTSEPPSHLDCAEWAVRVCPFLTRPRMHRRDAGLPDDATSSGGIGIDRNPGCTLVWTARRFDTFRTRAADGGGQADGWLIQIGDPEHVEAYAEGRRATHDELWESIRTGIPLLADLARQEGPDAVEALRGHLTKSIGDLVALNLLDPLALPAALQTV